MSNSQHWTQDRDLLEQAWAWFAQTARDFGHPVKTTPNPWEDEELKTLYDTLNVRMKDCTLFSVWKTRAHEALVNALGMPSDLSMTVHAKVTRNYGPLAVEFGMSAQFDMTMTTLAAAQAWLTHRIEIMHTNYVRDSLAKDLPANANPGQTETIEFDTLSISVVDGKRGYKLKGGKYKEFGVRIWPEVLKNVRPDHETMQPGEHAVFYRGVVQLNDRQKPTKVTAIEIG